MLYLDGVARSEDHTVALAKLLSSSFIIRGAQLSVVRRLDSQHVVDVHTSALTWIGKRLGAYEAAKNKKARGKALAFFKCLTPLCAAVDGKDFLKMYVFDLFQIRYSTHRLSLIAKRIWNKSLPRPR